MCWRNESYQRSRTNAFIAMEFGVLSIIVKLGGRNICFTLHTDPNYQKNCPKTRLAPRSICHTAGTLSLGKWNPAQNVVHQVPSAGSLFPEKSVSCSHKPKAKNQNGLLKARLSFLLLEEKSTAAKSVDTATTRRETFHKTGFVCNNQWGKGKQAESQLRGSRSSHPSILILQAPEKQVQQEHNYYNTVSVAQSS